jgi:hypothetical protein
MISSVNNSALSARIPNEQLLIGNRLVIHDAEKAPELLALFTPMFSLIIGAPKSPRSSQRDFYQRPENNRLPIYKTQANTSASACRKPMHIMN